MMIGAEDPVAHGWQLPAETSSFIGRGAALRRAEELVREHRLVTIVGASGVGKTRLALRAALGLRRDFRDGVRFIGLADTVDASHVSGEFMRAFGIEDSPGCEAASLALALGERAILIVVDNCEQVAEACARMVLAALESDVMLHVLATSREALRVPGEVVLPLGTMELPVAGEEDAQRLTGNEAVQLFVERVAEHDGTIGLTKEELPLIGELCRQLDGIPLAIELAAGAVSVVGLERIVSLAAGGLVLDLPGARAPSRHSSLRAAIEWGYSLLENAERALLARLAVFRDGWTLDAAIAVCMGPDTDSSRQIVLTLSSLVDKSFVVTQGAGQGRRFRLLEPVRQFSAELMQDPDANLRLHERHAAYYAGLLRREESGFSRGHREASVSVIEQEIGNLRELMDWAFSDGTNSSAVTLGMEVAGRLFLYWHFHGPRVEGLHWAERGIALGAERNDGIAAELYRVAGELTWLLGDDEGAFALLRRSITMWRALGDRRGLAYALQAIAPLECGSGRWGAVEESLGLFNEEGDQWGQGLVYFDGGIIAMQDGDFETAEMWMEKALLQFRMLGDDWFGAQVLNHLGDVARQRGDTGGALRRYGEALVLCRQLRDGVLLPSVYSNLGATELGRGHTRRALEQYRRALREFRNRGDTRGVAECLVGIAGVRLAMRQPVPAVELFAAAAQLFTSSRTRPWVANMGSAGLGTEVAHAQLSAEKFGRAWARGSARRAADVITQALAGDLTVAADAGAARAAGLTGREGEVAMLMARGLSNRAIAERLVIAEGTAGLHAKRVLQKLGCHSRAEVAGKLQPQG